MKIRLMTSLCVASVIAFSCKKDSSQDENLNLTFSPYLSKVYEFKPAPGQFTNEGGDDDLAKTKVLIGDVGKGLISLGAYGGYIVFGFDHPVNNLEGVDLGIYGNPLLAAGMEFSEPGIVSVMQDKNKNGIPDDEWFELAGSDYNALTTIKNYKITYYKPENDSDDIRWTDNQGGEGLVLKNQFHTQNYYPNWATTSQISFTGTLVKNTLAVDNFVMNYPLGIGYADNGSSDYLDLQNQFGRGYNTFNIDWAVNVKGEKVALTTIDFVKIYTAQNSNGNPYSPDNDNPKSRYIGEISTEFAGAVDLQLLKQQTK